MLAATVPRFYLPVKPCLTCANLGGVDGFAELGTRFKASHVKRIIWWLARETQEFADHNPQAPWAVLFTTFLGKRMCKVLHPNSSKYHQTCGGKESHRMVCVFWFVVPRYRQLQISPPIMGKKSLGMLFICFIGLPTLIEYLNQGPSSECAGNDVLFITTGDRAHGLLGAYFHEG